MAALRRESFESRRTRLKRHAFQAPFVDVAKDAISQLVIQVAHLSLAVFWLAVWTLAFWASNLCSLCNSFSFLERVQQSAPRWENTPLQLGYNL